MGSAAGERAAKAMKLLGHILGLQTRRTFYLMRPGSLGATVDERTLIALIGAVLHDRRPPCPCHGYHVIAIVLSWDSAGRGR